MASAVFDYREFHQLIEVFAANLPALFARHRTTTDLIPRVADLLNVAETPFTVAIIGQMRVGKSSLLNALVGADLAVTGTTETTATINWFKHGEPRQCGRFRVVWKDRPAEEFPLDQISHWVHDSGRAAATRYIEFFADTAFLRRANVVDTPGTRSTIESHEDTTNDFLAVRREQETQREGEAADAILYVLPCVVRESDQELLASFESGTRLTGSYPYNSLAVIHKWEALLDVPDPLAEAQRKADKMSARMADFVVRVLPVSAPLAMAAQHFPDTFWTAVLELTANSPAAVLDELLSYEPYFKESDQPCGLDKTARQRLRTQFRLKEVEFPWNSFRIVVNLARVQRPGSAQALRCIVDEASGLAPLRAELEQRFFSRSRMIKAFSVLSKAWEPCQVASASAPQRYRAAQHLAERSRPVTSLPHRSDYTKYG